MGAASPMSATTSLGAELAYGSGYINPLKAVDPGLVYEARKEDCIKLLCSIYDEYTVILISGDDSVTCSDGHKKSSPTNLNYPSMAAALGANTPFTLSFRRTVTNVGVAKSTDKAKSPQVQNSKSKWCLKSSPLRPSMRKNLSI
ncbi:subtilisin-like protease SBT4.4 [Ricinus communis]|uniref:subtilisin-like protease SBT4.4 n=1 Tax=Ricinus communis TaxID=3988 RepID=UPI00201AC20C|nr:subtilisin-like protease SBT4.4 [Ricinus communis]